MAKRLGISIGWVTNSSSVIHHFPRTLLQHPDVKKFFDDFGLHNGFVGTELWYRSACASIAVTEEQKTQLRNGLRFYGARKDIEEPIPDDHGYNASVHIEDDPNMFVVVYGDEYSGIARTLSDFLTEIAQSLKISLPPSRDYN